MNAPLVSVLVPCFNHSSYVTDTLNSILADTYKNKELIIIDDGSSDNSVAVIQDWLKKNENSIKSHFVYRENKGVCYTLNELVGLSKGKYLVPIASDDLLCQNTISERVKILEINESKGKYVLVSDAIVIDSNGKDLFKSAIEDYNSGNKKYLVDDNSLLEMSFLKPCFSGATLFINKKIYDIIGPYPLDLNAEDWYFYQRVACSRSLMFKDLIVSKYRVHNKNTSGLHISKEKRVIMFKAILLTYYKNWKHIPELNIKLKVFIKAIKLIVRIVKYQYL